MLQRGPAADRADRRRVRPGRAERGRGATAKHFIANESETERQTVDARVDERTLHEVYLAPFEAAVRSGVWAVMAAYNRVNGEFMTESEMLTRRAPR